MAQRSEREREGLPTDGNTRSSVLDLCARLPPPVSGGSVGMCNHTTRLNAALTCNLRPSFAARKSRPAASRG
jgi:hypothetical protein